MTLPSAVLQAMRDTLESRLGASAGEVRIHDGALDASPKSAIKGADPLVLVTSLGANLQPDGYGIADAVWAVFVLTRYTASSDGKTISRSVAAANVAALVAAIVESEKWGGLMYAPASRVRIANEFSEKLGMGDGWGVWSVAWTQPYEIKVADAAQYGRLGAIQYTFAMGGVPTPDALATIEFPEPTP